MTVEPMLRDKLIESLRQNPDMSPQELAKKHDANLSYCYVVKQKWEKNKKPFESEKTVTQEVTNTEHAPVEPQKPQSISVEVTEVMKPEIIEQGKEEKPALQLPEGVKKALMEGQLDPEDITSVFQAVNQLFPDKHQRPDKAMIILGKLWYRPANKILEEYSDKNPLLVIAVLMTLVTFAPSIKGVIEEWNQSRKSSPTKEKKSA